MSESESEREREREDEEDRCVRQIHYVSLGGSEGSVATETIKKLSPHLVIRSEELP